MTKGLLVWGQIDLSSSIKLVFFSVSLSLSALFSPLDMTAQGHHSQSNSQTFPWKSSIFLTVPSHFVPFHLSPQPYFDAISWRVFLSLLLSVSLVHSSKPVTFSDPLRAAKGPQRGLPWSHDVPGCFSQSSSRRQGPSAAVGVGGRRKRVMEKRVMEWWQRKLGGGKC